MSKRSSLNRVGASLGVLLVLFHFVTEYAVAKKNFKGLFGSYRREKFTENEGNDSDWGADIILSTLYPLSSMANSTTSVASGSSVAMPKTISFDVELNLYKTFGYNTMVFFNIGHYSYDSRQQTQAQATTDENNNDVSAITQYNNLATTIIPLMLGIKYRFSRSDFVPYLGASAGISLMSRKITYNYSNLSHEDSTTPLTFQGFGGFEFFFAPGAGLRVELGVWTALAPEVVKNTNSAAVESIIFPSNPLAVRYASGVFFLF